ncbi:MAG: hypothetical protein ABSB75_01575 [Candidatus Limnocylindrales bacterium]
MAINIAGRSVSIAALLGLAGGILAIVGVPLAWISLSPGGDVLGTDDGLMGGRIALVLGIVIVVLAAAWILKVVKVPSIAGLSTLALLTAIAGVLIVLVVVLVYFTNILSDESFTHTADMMKAAGGSASLGIGVLLDALGGILAIVGGVWALLKKS